MALDSKPRRDEPALDLIPVPGARRQAFRVALRMARRDIRRHKGRSLLISLLIMLPVAGMTGALTLFESTRETAAERVEYQLGATQARYRVMAVPNGSLVQDPIDETKILSSSWDSDPGFTPQDPRELVPAGYEVLTEASLDLTAVSGAADVPLIGRAVDALAPEFAGKYILLEGKAPANDTEILVSPGLLERFGMDVGEELPTSAGTFVAVGTLRDFGYSDSNSIAYLKPGQGTVVSRGGAAGRDAADSPDRSVATSAAAATINSTVYYLVGAEPVTWGQVREANMAGVAVLSRSVALNPPSAAQLALDNVAAASNTSIPLAAYAGGALLGALALLEVGLLAGAAFAVGAKGQVRDLAMLAATGAEAPTVRTVVMAAGLWLGGIGVTAGAAVGLAAAAGVVMVARLNGSVRFPGFHPEPLLTLGVMAMGFVACLLAALAPARQVARQAVLGALKSGRAPQAPGRLPTALGAVLLLVSAAASGAGSWLAFTSEDPDVFAARTPVIAWLMLGGAVLAVTSLVLLTGTVVGFLARQAGRLPLAGRMAARDSSRNRSRTVPAVAAVLAAATLASAGMVLAASQQANDQQNHQWSALKNQGVLPLVIEQQLPAGTRQEPSRVAPDAVEAALRGALDTVEWTHVLRAPAIRNCEMRPDLIEGTPAQTPASSCPQYALAVPAGNECPVSAGQRVLDPEDWRCRGPMRPYPGHGSAGSMVIGTAADVEKLLGKVPTAEAREVLASGGMVVTNPVFVRDGKVSLVAQDVRQPAPSLPGVAIFQGYLETGRTEVAAAVVEPDVNVPYYGIVSPEAAAAAGMQAEDGALLVQLSDYPDAAQADALASALASVNQSRYGFIYVERGAERDASLILWSIVGLGALITLSAAGITTGLSMADSRKDHVTLAGVGAAPRLRKALAGSQALMTAGLGTVLGSVAGIVPALLLVTATGMARTAVVPWLQLAALLVAVPLAGAALAWLFTRAKLPVSRREVGT